ncbi:NAD(P)-binding domain-containing protein [Streptomyces sp. NPDC012769]|uniref:NAD(P)-binding domain-containing protein n=1 Tax=Streptomyces sp. NPDC012769 TaxID=3364848 RepID=UPI00369570FA
MSKVSGQVGSSRASPETQGSRCKRVTVIGLGRMGRALAEAFLREGYETTVWNRTAARAEPLLAAGARFAPLGAGGGGGRAAGGGVPHGLRGGARAVGAGGGRRSTGQSWTCRTPSAPPWRWSSTAAPARPSTPTRRRHGHEVRTPLRKGSTASRQASACS